MHVLTFRSVNLQTHMLRRMTSQFNDAFHFISADGLKCYQCSSTSSWGDCNQSQIKGICASWLDTCAKVYREVKRDGVSVKEYLRGCTNKEKCDAKDSPLCNGECDINCCNTNFCNTAAIQVINVVFLVLCAFLALVLMP